MCDNCSDFDESYKKFNDEQNDVLNMYDLDFDHFNSLVVIYVQFEDFEIPVLVEV